MTQGREHRWRTPPGLWAKLKPLARQMRKKLTLAEALFWQRLRKRQVLGHKFRRQHAIERFIVDFYCRDARLVVEVDGPIHQYTQEEEAIRQTFLESQELEVIRFSNQEIVQHISRIVERVTEALKERP